MGRDGGSSTPEGDCVMSAVDEQADLLLYSVENPSPKTQELREKAYRARYGMEAVAEAVYDHRMALVIAEMHQHIANKFLRQAGWLEGSQLLREETIV